LPLTVEAVPTEHRLVVGADIKLPLFELPHWPFTGGCWLAEQETLLPP
jgi:hypothetical protein